MKKLSIYGILINLLLTLVLASVQAESERLVTIQAQVTNYKADAIRLDFEDNVFEWKDAILVRIVSPQKWKGKEIELLCEKEPENSLWRKIGNTYEFSIPDKYLVESNINIKVKHILFLGDIVGDVKFVNMTQK